ncbi:MAG: hypothetical protein HN736_02980 [Anaerolineae bacterium]|jgi:hypothetical protein|nr:hypothetical protein [Anaerolineae bacterium]MBT3711865.1 hypothetical protein [Anaerolineae bacterium]MBT4311127.1 hypothetical protein [Anaerolineae bacterium]MBT4459388.1 hypothetical protein [Anaerolineae bacterium]MBT4841290.1 hypothetical protein [Anaerolineae bacterium]
MLTLLLAGSIALIYGAFTAFDALKAMRQEKLSLSSAALMGFIGLIIMFSSLFIPFQIQLAFYALLAGLIALHIVAIKNDLAMHGKINPKHHIVRLIISLVIAGMAFSGVFLS